MELNRRDFLKLSGAGIGATAALGFLPLWNRDSCPQGVSAKEAGERDNDRLLLLLCRLRSNSNGI